MTSNEEFKKLFTFDKDGLRDIKSIKFDGLGVIVTVKYPNSIYPKISYYQETLESILRICIEREELEKISSLKFLDVSIHFWRKLRSPDYPPGSYAESFEYRKGEKYPISLQFSEFKFDIHSNQIFLEDSPINGNQLLEYVLEKHFLNTRFIAGFRIRLKHFKRKFTMHLFDNIYKVTNFVLFALFGKRSKLFNETIVTDILKDAVKRNRNVKEETENREKNIDIFGIKVESWSITSFAFINLLLYIIIYKLCSNKKLIAEITNSTLLSFFYLAVALFLYEKCLYNLLEFIIEYSKKRYEKVFFSSISF